MHTTNGVQLPRSCTPLQIPARTVFAGLLRKFFELHASNKSQIAGQALQFISALYDVEREIKYLTADARLHIRQTKSRPLADALYQWMDLQRRQITDGSATAKVLDYSLKRWGALTRFLDDGQLPIR